MKQALFVFIVLMSLIIPLACSDNNNNPSKPVANISAPTATPNGSTTPTYTPTLSPTITLTPATTFTITSTPTTTSTFEAAPVYSTQWRCASNPNGLAFDPNGNLYVAEGITGGWAGIEWFNPSSGVLLFQTNEVVLDLNGNPQTILLHNVIGLDWDPIDPSTWGPTCTILDSCEPQSSGATIYTGDSATFESIGIPIIDIAYGVGYGSAYPFNNPQGLQTDGTYYYVADTGNKYVENFEPYEGPSIAPIHRVNGSYKSTFMNPVAMATDPSGDIFVADTGYVPSVIQEFKSGGLTFVGGFTGAAGSVVTGLAIDPNTPTHLYATDSANGTVEEFMVPTPPAVYPNPYTPYTNSSVLLMKQWTDKQGYYEANPFTPTGIIIDDLNQNVVVSDSLNRIIDVFHGL